MLTFVSVVSTVGRLLHEAEKEGHVDMGLDMNTRNMVTVGHRDFLDINVPGFFLKF